VSALLLGAGERYLYSEVNHARVSSDNSDHANVLYMHTTLTHAGHDHEHTSTERKTNEWILENLFYLK